MAKGSRWITDEEFIEAIMECGGIKTEIAKKLNCTWPTVHNRIKGSEVLAQAQLDAVETTLDRAEKIIGKNLELLSQEQDTLNKPVATDDAWKYLERKGKARGFGNKVDFDSEGGVSIEVTITTVGKKESE